MKIDLYLKNNSCVVVNTRHASMDSFAEHLACSQIKGFTNYKDIEPIGDYVVIDDEYIRYDEIVHFRAHKEDK
ncbi:hypothetical protein D307_gp015 [Bacillus phage Bastille]|uniref:Uncharacterized protein n=1 Tax=Bacillus phage Bastille TaxID=57477 RepID=J9PKR8_9CAUD|nr:hypothetical protein D307_gp015 [Bacillus phage Bastille]AEQ34449.1 hypothetical protein [Bacillus phage Bastille]AZF89149.1 hypothetical protein Goe5_c00410 [Bacillus phage vB_BthM-Goe5]